jgi:signal transduction histidine kinase
MNSVIGIAIIALLFLLTASITVFLIKRNVFRKNPIDGDNSLEFENSDKKERLNQLKQENNELNKEIKFLEEKNRKLNYKIEQLKQVIKNLREQKSQLEVSEKRLKDLRVRKDETLAMVAHDLKNPASTIKNFVSLLESYDLTAQEQSDILSGLMEISSRIVQLADEFTFAVAEEYEPFAIHKGKINFCKTVDDIVKVNKINASKKNIELRLYQPKDEILLDLDEGKIKEVIDNYVSNAIKYCPEKSKIEIITNKENKFVTFEVKDNGFGLTEDEVAHAFEKGTKLSNRPTGNESSSGLGLWIVKRIVEEHNGKVWVKSKKGFGSTFAFTIPIE